MDQVCDSILLRNPNFQFFAKVTQKSVLLADYLKLPLTNLGDIGCPKIEQLLYQEKHGMGHCLNTLSEQHRQLAQLYKRLSMSDKSKMELVADCHGMTEVNLITALGFYSMTSSIESLELLERAHGHVTSFSVEVFPGALWKRELR